MPSWLVIVLSVWGGGASFITVIGIPTFKLFSGLFKRVGAMEQHFDPTSAVAQAVGTLPTRLDGVTKQVDDLERKVTDVVEDVDHLDEHVKSINRRIDP